MNDYFHPSMLEDPWEHLNVAAANIHKRSSSDSGADDDDDGDDNDDINE